VIRAASPGSRRAASPSPFGSTASRSDPAPDVRGTESSGSATSPPPFVHSSPNQRFPLQVAIGLSRPGTDYEGGEFLLVEQRPRQQSRGEAVRLGPGDAVVFPTTERPVRGARGPYRAKLRHGVARVRRGHRMTLGIIFHDAKS